MAVENTGVYVVGIGAYTLSRRKMHNETQLSLTEEIAAATVIGFN